MPSPGAASLITVRASIHLAQWLLPFQEGVLRIGALVRFSRGFIQFNQAILWGEVGSLIGIPLFPWIVSQFTAHAAMIAGSAVMGGMVSGSICWLIVKINHEQASGRRAAWNLARKIAYFSPAAFVIGATTYQPTLFLVSYWLINHGDAAVYAVLVSQALAFGLFLAAMNLYRLAIHRLTAEWI